MKDLHALGGAVASAAAAVALCAGAAMAQPAPKPTAPPLTGPGSLTGVWFNASFTPVRTGPPTDTYTGALNNLRTADGQPVPLLPWAAKVVVDRKVVSDNGEPFANLSSRCIPNGVPQMMFPPPSIPIQFLETAGQTTVLFEEMTTFRVIRMDDKHPDDPDPTLNGDSVGHWEGDTLVVDTTALSDLTSVQGVIPHSDQLHVVERFRRTGPDTMESRTTIEDPKTFSRPFTYVFDYKRVPGEKLTEWLCTNNRNRPTDKGAVGVQLK